MAEVAERQKHKHGQGIDRCRKLGRTRAIFKQATNWSKTLKGLSDFTFMDLYTYLVSSRNKAFDHESLKAYRYFADDLVRNAHAGHIPANDLVAIKAHCFISC